MSIINKIQMPDGNTYDIQSTSSGITWGNITGTLSNQTDLYNSLSAKADTSLSNLTTTGYKKMYGQIVQSVLSLSTSTSIGTYTCSLSSYLPSDSYKYEVCFVHNFYDAGDNSGEIYQWTDIYSKSSWYVSQGNKYARHNSCIVALPVGTGRTYYFSLNNATSGHQCWAVWYRRIGTNT